MGTKIWDFCENKKGMNGKGGFVLQMIDDIFAFLDLKIAKFEFFSL
jgi:hypothetical protein